MIYQHFIGRLFLCLISGILFIAAFSHLAISNPIKDLPHANKYKWIGYILYALSVIQLIAFIYFCTQIEFPLTSTDSLFPKDGIVRNSSVHIIWGYATIMQRFALTFFIGTFACLGFAQYFVKFKPSPSKWWLKVLKFIGGVLMWMLYVNSTDFHYFDTYEWVKIGLYLCALWICFTPSTKTKDDAELSPQHITSDETLPPPYNFFTQSENIDLTDSTISNRSLENKIASDTKSETSFELHSTTLTNTPNLKICYCKYCGHKIETDSNFCKYCGRPTSEGTIKANFNFDNFVNFFRRIKSKITLPRFQFKKSESTNSKLIASLKYIVPISLFPGVVAIILCIIYFNHSWNYNGFNCLGVQDKFALILGFSTAIIVCGLLTWLLLYWHNKSKLNFIKIVTFSFAYFTITACAGNIICIIISLCKFEKYYHSIVLDNAIVDRMNPLHTESIKHFFDSIDGTFNDHYGYSNQVVDILRTEAKANNAHAQNELGRHYFSYVEWTKKQPDYERAIYWFMKAYENGNPAGAYNVGLCYDYGKGVAENIEKAVEWTLKAAEMGYAPAELKIGDFYKTGVSSWNGIWSEREVESGDNRIYQYAISTGQTQYSTAVLPKDLSKANYWWNRAESHGEDEAVQRLESFYQ